MIFNIENTIFYNGKKIFDYDKNEEYLSGLSKQELVKIIRDTCNDYFRMKTLFDNEFELGKLFQ